MLGKIVRYRDEGGDVVEREKARRSRVRAHVESLEAVTRTSRARPSSGLHRLFRVAESRLCALANSPPTALIGAAVRRALRKYVAEQRGVGNSFVGLCWCGERTDAMLS
jgi:hypothetical protein